MTAILFNRRCGIGIGYRAGGGGPRAEGSENAGLQLSAPLRSLPPPACSLYPMCMVNRVCVFCGSAMGVGPAFREAAAALGVELVERGWGLVFGGGSVGLMGVVADAVLEGGGEVIGVIPQALATKELLHVGVRDMRRVRDMHERKAVMSEHADAFVALPGGYGTFEETVGSHHVGPARFSSQEHRLVERGRLFRSARQLDRPRD